MVIEGDISPITNKQEPRKILFNKADCDGLGAYNYARSQPYITKNLKANLFIYIAFKISLAYRWLPFL